MAPFRRLEEVVSRAEQRRVPFSALMPWRVRSILLVSSLYDSFTFEEDGNLSEMLFSEYLELNLRYAPVIERVSTAQEAIATIRRHRPDLIITMPRVGEMDVAEFGREIESIAPDVPLVLLAYDTRELALLKAREDLPTVERFFVWQGDVRLFLAIIKWAEDRMNAAHDAETAGVKSILLVEDSVRFYSAYLPLLYTEIVEQTQGLMAEGVNRMQKLLRMRARPKILLATSYEEGREVLKQYRDHVLGVIVDARFPKGGRVDSAAGADFVRLVQGQDPGIPVLMQSTEGAQEATAQSLGVTFINKTSPLLLHKVRDFLRAHLGFGEFVFRRPDGAVIATAQDLRELVEQLKTVPDEALLHHASRNDFSTWLMARTEFDLAKALRPVKATAFPTARDLRKFLMAALNVYRGRSRAGLVAEFSSETFEPESGFTRIGPGSLGGKGRGLAFVHSLLNAYEIERAIRGVRIFVPPTAVLATGIFDRFMERSGLTPMVLGPASDEEIRRAFLEAELPQGAIGALRAFLNRVDYPLAVRSSSLLEDSSHQPFAGIYQTYMLPNNDPDPDVRLEELCRAIRLVYASTYYADSKSYIESTPNRLEEEKMAVVIQQVVGRRHGEQVYPDIAGVTRSYDYYPMPQMVSEDGVASVALGLGRTVVEGERCLRFNPAHPQKLYQFSSTRDYLANSQRAFYALDLSGTAEASVEGHLVQLDLDRARTDGTLSAVGSVYSPENDTVYEGIHRPGTALVSMAGVLNGTYFPLPETLNFLMEVGKAGLSCHVEIEFAVNLHLPKEGPHELAFLQIRPLVFGSEGQALDLGVIDRERAICLSSSALGHGRIESIRDIVYVRQETFDRGKSTQIASEVGALNGKLRNERRPYLLIGPGRWGSADPWLGIPVTWAQISGARCIVECGLDDIQVTPSQGTHFFQNITSFGIGYFTVAAGDRSAYLDHDWLDAQDAADVTESVRHLRFARDLEVVVDGRTRAGAILRPRSG